MRRYHTYESAEAARRICYRELMREGRGGSSPLCGRAQCHVAVGASGYRSLSSPVRDSTITTTTYYH